jgi:hypothetical protein
LRQAKGFRSDRIARESLKRERRDEFHCAASHNHPNLETILDEEPHQLDCFVTRDAARDPKNNHPLLTVGRHAPKLADQPQGCKLRWAITIRSTSVDLSRIQVCVRRASIPLFRYEQTPGFSKACQKKCHAPGILFALCHGLQIASDSAKLLTRLWG